MTLICSMFTGKGFRCWFERPELSSQERSVTTLKNSRAPSPIRPTRRAGLLFFLAIAALGYAPPFTVAADRAVTDRPDDVAGYQIHFMYVIPSDGLDQEFDLDGSIAAAASAGGSWLLGQTGGRSLKFDTYQGALDITFFRVSRTDAQLRQYGIGIRDQIQHELLAAGFNHPQKIYAVLYGGSTDGACGLGGGPPFGKVGLLILQRGGGACIPPIASGLALSWGYGFLHEVFHNLGMVPTCASHYAAGHVSDDAQDLMSPTIGGKDPLFLDRGHDDYFESHIPGCLDLANTTFFEPPSPSPAPPPGWPPAPLVSQSCDRESVLRPRANQTPIGIDFINSTGAVAQLFVLDSNGQRVLIRTLQPWDDAVIGAGATLNPTFITQPWVMTDAAGTCLAVFSAETPQEQRGYRNFVAIPTAPPSVHVVRNEAAFHTGDMVTVGIDAQNPGGHSAADLYAGVLLPDGLTLVFLTATGTVAAVKSLADDPSTFPIVQTVPPGTDLSLSSFLQFTLPATGVPPGTYQFFAALVRQGALGSGQVGPGDIFAVDMEPVTFSP